MNRGHVPIRRCIGCRQRRPACEMIRLRADRNRVIVADASDKTPGRGCYVCPREECIKAALEKDRLSRALRRSMLIAPSQETLLTRQE
jgi:uncharacterized protein